MAKSGYTKFGVGLSESEKRAHIKAAAKVVFGRLGYRSAKITDILNEAGIARRTFYVYFKRKEDVLIELLDDFHTELECARNSEPPERLTTIAELRAQISRIAGVMTGVFLRNRDLLKVVFEGRAADDRVLAPRSENIVDLFTLFIREYIEVALSKGLTRKVDPGITSMLLVGMYLETMRRLLLRQDTTPFADWAREFLALVDYGFLGDHA